MGKMVLLVVLGVYMILGRILLTNHSIATDTVNNIVEYYSNSNVRHIASTGAQIAISNLLRDKSWRPNSDYHNLEFSNGSINLDVVNVAGGKDGEVNVYSVATYADTVDTVIVNMCQVPFCRWGWFIDQWDPNGWFISGRIIDGPFHCNTTINLAGKPIFKGEVSLAGDPPKIETTYGKDPADPEFDKGWHTDAITGLPVNLDGMKYTATSAGFYTDKEMDIVFNNNSTVSYRFYSGHSWGSWNNNVQLSTIAPNGLIYSDGDVHVKGKIDGSVTVTSGKNIWIDGDVGVKDDPQTNPNSTQFLGLAADKKVIITNNSDNQNDCNITASIYTGDDLEIEPETKSKQWPVSGKLTIYGSRTQQSTGAIGHFNGFGKIVDGYEGVDIYDKRLAKYNKPPQFPMTTKMHVVSWWE